MSGQSGAVSNIVKCRCEFSSYAVVMLHKKYGHLRFCGVVFPFPGLVFARRVLCGWGSLGGIDRATLALVTSIFLLPPLLQYVCLSPHDYICSKL